MKPQDPNIPSGNNMTTASSNYQSIHLQSEAFDIFAQDFALLKKTVLQLTHRLNQQLDCTSNLELDIETLKSENLKLVTDVKILRNDHQELLNQMFGLERKNQYYANENEALRRLIHANQQLDQKQGERQSSLSPFRSEEVAQNRVGRSMSSQNRENSTRDLILNYGQRPEDPKRVDYRPNEPLTFQQSLNHTYT